MSERDFEEHDESDRRFETELFWNDDDPELPESYTMAVKLLKFLENRLR